MGTSERPESSHARFTTLIGACDLASLPAGEVRVFDCRFDLADPDAWRGANHPGDGIPGATHVHLDDDLSGAVVAGQTGRHPLPSKDRFQGFLERHGAGHDRQLVAYDASGGMFAARFWWLARWAGYTNVAVLDGGLDAWRTGRSSQAPRQARLGTPRVVSMPEVRRHVDAGSARLLDARAHDRYLGKNETLDAKAGHIPGALSAPYFDNLDDDDHFQPPNRLRARFAELVPADAGNVVCYCGSGVSAAHNVLAMVHAGLPEPALYAGSWSEWITDPANPVA